MSNTAYMPGLLIAGLVVGLVVGVFVPQVHQAYVTETRTQLVEVTETVPQTVHTTELATIIQTKTDTVTEMHVESVATTKVATETQVVKETVTTSVTVEPILPIRKISSNSWYDEYGWLHVAAELQYIGTEAISFFRISIILYDNSDSIVTTATFWYGAVQPGQRIVAEQYFTDPYVNEKASGGTYTFTSE